MNIPNVYGETIARTFLRQPEVPCDEEQRLDDNTRLRNPAKPAFRLYTQAISTGQSLGLPGGGLIGASVGLFVCIALLIVANQLSTAAAIFRWMSRKYAAAAHFDCKCSTSHGNYWRGQVAD